MNIIIAHIVKICTADFQICSVAHCCRVAEKDWGADFRKLSAGASLVGLTLWLDRMQVCSLFSSTFSACCLIASLSQISSILNKI